MGEGELGGGGGGEAHGPVSLQLRGTEAWVLWGEATGRSTQNPQHSCLALPLGQLIPEYPGGRLPSSRLQPEKGLEAFTFVLLGSLSCHVRPALPWRRSAFWSLRGSTRP